MKAVAQQARSAKVRSPRPIGARVQTKARPGAGNRHRADAHERQADEAAVRVLRGEEGVGRMLTPTRAAGWKIAGSPGEPLPGLLREELERGFGAELSAIRLHRDAVANAASQAHFANAFASGPDIYFSAGAFDATSPNGRRLIAHEVAHVLQQTGRASGEGRLRATAHLSTGLVQCDAKLPPFADLRKLHKRGTDDTGKYSAVADELERLLKATDSKAKIEQYARKNLPGLGSWPERAESLLFDTLKSVQAWDTAAELIERDDYAGGTRILTAAQSGWVDDALKRRFGGSGVFALALEHSTLLKAYLEEFLRLIEVFVLQPINDAVPMLYNPQSKGKETIAEHIERHTKALEDNTVLKGNEWFTPGLSVVRFLDDWRVEKCLAMQQAASLERGRPVIFRKRPFASGMRDWGAKIAKQEMTTPEATAGWKPQFERIGKLVTGVGNRINKLWDRAQVFDAARAATAKAKGGKMSPDVASLIPVFNAARGMAEKTNLPALLEATLDKVNAPDSRSRRPPAPDEYAKRALKLADELEEYSRKNIEAPQAALFRQDKSDEVVAALWLAIELSEIARTLRAGGGTDAGRLRVADVNYLIAHRIWMAWRVWNLAGLFAWSGALRSAATILNAELDTSSQLALLPDQNGQVWVATEEKDAPIERMLDDVGSGAIRDQPFTFYSLVLYFRTENYRKLTKELKRLLPESAQKERDWIQNAAEKDLFLISEAYQAGRTGMTLEPVRMVAANVEFAEKQGSSLKFDDLLYAKIKDEPWFKDLLARALTGYLPTVFKDPLVMWFLPPPGRIAATLRKSTLLNNLVTKVFAPGKKTLSDQEWLDAFMKLKWTALSSNSQKALIEEMQGLLLKEYQTQLDLLLPELRRATTIDRQAIARHVADRIGLRKRPGNAMQPLHALELIRAFITSIQPVEDLPVQLAALMLELAPVLDDAFGNETWFALVHGYLGLLEDAQAAIPALTALADDARGRILPKDENSREWIDQRKKRLDSIVSHFQSVRQMVQTEYGFRAIAEPENVLVDQRYGYSAPSGTELIPTSLSTTRFHPYSVPAESRYTFIKALRSFDYRSSYGSESAKKQSATKTGAKPGELVDSVTGQKLEVKAGEKLLEVFRGKKRIQVGADQMDVLQEIAEGVSYYGHHRKTQRSLAILGAMIYFYQEALELLPGGQVITVSRLMAAVDEFFSSGAYEDAKKLLGGDLSKLLDGVTKMLSDALDPETLVLMILLPDPRLEKVLSAAEGVGPGVPAKASSRRGHGRFGWIGKALRAFRKLGRGLARAAGFLHEHVQEPMQEFRSFASTRPTVAVAFNFAANNIYTLSTLATEAYLSLVSTSEQRKGSGEALVRDTINEQQKGIADRVHGVLQSIEQIQLPAKVIHMEPIVQKLVNELIDFIGNRMGLKGKIAVKLLSVPGIRDFKEVMTLRISEEIVSAGADPNIVWTDTVVPKIEGYFNSARSGVVDEVNKILKAKPFEGLFTSVPKRAPLKVKVDGDPFPDTQVDLDAEETGVFHEPEEPQPHPSADRPLRVRPPSVPGVGSGRRLDAAQRGSMESSFRQDFRHVRLHVGADGEAMTRQFGADALTTGSHIFLRGGVSPQSPRGERLLRHELTHVVQQSGARPTGDRPEGTPVVGRPERGLRVDPGSERDAERAAAGSPAGVSAASGQADGLQPAGLSLSTMAELLKAFSDLEALEHARNEVQAKTKGRKKPVKLNSTQATVVVENILKALDSLDPKTVKCPHVFSSVSDKIVKRLKDDKDDIRLAAFQIASQKLDDLPAKPATGKGPATSTRADPEQVLKPGFERQLEGYIMTSLGIGVSFKLNTEKVHAPSGDKVEVIAQKDTVKELAITYLHLPYIDGRNPLWGDAIQNTWETLPSKTSVPTLKEYQDKARGILKPLLTGRPISLSIWGFTKKYRFSYLLEKDVDDLIEKKSTETRALDPKDLPSAKDYVKTDPKLDDNIGLRIATYKDGSQSGTGRESHHLTQYLVAEYFNNAATTPAFKKARKYPGVKKDRSGEVELISKSAIPSNNANESVLVKDTRSGRGDVMPAISLAAAAHRGPDLHITTEADEIKGDTRKTQSHRVNNTFQKAMSAALGPDSKDPDFAAYVGSKSDDDIAKEIYAAVQTTYRDVEKHMNRQFRIHMPRKEIAYFEEMTLARDPTKPLDSQVKADLERDLKAIPDVAYAHNKTGMEKLGWKLS